MNKRIVGMVTVLSMLLGLCACSVDESKNGAIESSETDEPKSYYDFGEVDVTEWVQQVSNIEIDDDTLVIGTFSEYDNDITEKVNEILDEKGKEEKVVFVRIPYAYQADGKISDFVQYMGENNVKLDIYPAWEADMPYLLEKNQMYDITDYLESEDGRHVKDAVNEAFWEITQKDGHYYGIGISRDNYGCWVVNKELMEKYDISEEELSKSLEELEPIFEKVASEGDGVIPFLYNSYVFSYIPFTMPDGRAVTGFWEGTFDGTVKNLFDTEGMYNWVKTINDYSQKGYAVYGNTDTDTNFFMAMSYSDVPMMRDDRINTWTNPNVELVTIPYYSTNQSSISTMLNVIPSWSKEPKKALEFLNLAFTDKEISETLLYGLAGREYTVENGTYNTTEQFNEQIYVHSSLGNLAVCSPMEPYADKQCDFVQIDVKEVEEFPLKGFIFKSDNVEEQIAAVMDVWGDGNKLDALFAFDKYGIAGYSSWDEYYEKFNSDLKKAGIDDIVEEMNRQIDEYLKE